MVELEGAFSKYNNWSSSKSSTWNKCRKAYYYNSIRPFSKDCSFSEKNKLRDLNKLIPKFAFEGKVIHQLIKGQIDKYKRGKDINKADAQNKYIESVNIYKGMAKNMIIEYYNGGKIFDSFFNKVMENGLGQVSNFFDYVWPSLKDYIYIQHEKFNTFHLGHIGVTVRLDYLCKTDGGKLIISDWKTGKSIGIGNTNLQIGAYTLWAMNEYGICKEEIQPQIIYLENNKKSIVKLNNDQLESVKNKITLDFKEMNKSYELDYFWADPDPKKCFGCNFSTICSDSAADEYLTELNGLQE